MENLEQLAIAIRNKNAADESVARIIGRPAQIDHTGEYIAASIFGIKLEQASKAKSSETRFSIGTLRGKSVDIKWYTKMEGLLDIDPDKLPDYYLVLTGPIGASASTREATRPWLISFVYLFDARDLLDRLDREKVKIGSATSIPKQLWHEAELYPEQRNDLLTLNNEQMRLLSLFGPL
jgi:hypothetical protein